MLKLTVRAIRYGRTDLILENAIYNFKIDSVSIKILTQSLSENLRLTL